MKRRDSNHVPNHVDIPIKKVEIDDVPIQIEPQKSVGIQAIITPLNW